MIWSVDQGRRRGEADGGLGFLNTGCCSCQQVEGAGEHTVSPYSHSQPCIYSASRYLPVTQGSLTQTLAEPVVLDPSGLGANGALLVRRGGQLGVRPSLDRRAGTTAATWGYFAKGPLQRPYPATGGVQGGATRCATRPLRSLSRSVGALFVLRMSVSSGSTTLMRTYY